MKKAFRNIFSRPFFQPLFDLLLFLSLKGMNIGDGQVPETSGESSVIRLLPDNATVFDVGAHIGEWADMAEKYYSGSGLHLYSFEPAIGSYQELQKKSSVIAVHTALGDFIGDTYLAGKDVTAHIGESGEKINVTTLDAYCHTTGITSIDLLKIDVEGYELKVLAGAKEMLKNRSIRMIQFEFGADHSNSLQAFYSLLSGYEIYRILRHGIVPIRYKHYYEIMTITNFLAILKE